METSSADFQRRRRPAVSQLESHLGYWLRRVSNHVSGSFAHSLRARRTSVAEWVVMCEIHGRPLTTPAELAETLGLTRGAVSKIIDKLEAKQWVAHSVKPEDGRMQLLSLTRQGRHIFPELVEIANRNDRECFQGLDSQELTTLRSLLRKLVDLHRIQNVPIG